MSYQSFFCKLQMIDVRFQIMKYKTTISISNCSNNLDTLPFMLISMFMKHKYLSLKFITIERSLYHMKNEKKITKHHNNVSHIALCPTQRALLLSIISIITVPDSLRICSFEWLMLMSQTHHYFTVEQLRDSKNKVQTQKFMQIHPTSGTVICKLFVC